MRYSSPCHVESPPSSFVLPSNKSRSPNAVLKTSLFCPIFENVFLASCTSPIQRLVSKMQLLTAFRNLAWWIV